MFEQKVENIVNLVVGIANVSIVITLLYLLLYVKETAGYIQPKYIPITIVETTTDSSDSSNTITLSYEVVVS